MANTIKNLGIVSPVPMGEWVSGIIYQKLNIVRHNGASYLAKQPTATEPGVSSSWESYWQLIAKDGIGGSSVVQTTGTSLTNVMSQDAVTKQLTSLNSSISANAAQIGLNSADIAKNKTSIAKNAADIESVGLQTSENTADIKANSNRINQNSTDIAANSTQIAQNTSDIEKNELAIAANLEALKNKFDKTGGVIDGSVVITENLNVKGKVIASEEITQIIKDAVIILNSDGADLSTTLAGTVIRINDNDTNNAYAIAYDKSTDSVKLGIGTVTETENGKYSFAFAEDEGEPVAVRDDSSKLTNGCLLAWDSVGNKLVDSNFGLTQGDKKYSIVQKRVADATIDSGTPAPDELCKAYQWGSSSFGGACQSGMTEDEFNAFYWDSSTQTAKNGGQGLKDGKVTDYTGRTYDKSRNYAFSVGGGNKALGRDSFAAGNSNITEALASAVFGFNNKVSNIQKYSFTVGRYNEDKANLLFSVGNGIDDSNRRNAFEIDTDGNVRTYRYPLTENDVTNRGYVNNVQETLQTQINSRVQNNGNPFRVYVTDQNGNNSSLVYGNTYTLGTNSFPIYSSHGTLKVANSETDNEAVNQGQLKTKLDKAGGTITGDLIIAGDLTVNGTEKINNVENLNVKDAMIYSNADGATLASLAGLGIKTNATDIYGIVYDYTSDSVKLGLGKADSNGKFTFNTDEGTAVATRDDSTKLTNGCLLAWDATNNKLVDSNFGLTAGDALYSIVQKRINSAGEVVATKAYQRGSMSIGGGTVAGDKDGVQTDSSFAFSQGELSNAIARATSAFNNSNATAEYAFSANKSNASGVQSASFNQGTASGELSFAAGDGSLASGKGSFAVGQGVKASADYMFAIGKFNANYNDSLFEVGYGTQGEEKTALAVNSIGDVTVTKAPRTEMAVVRKTDLDSAVRTLNNSLLIKIGEKLDKPANPLEESVITMASTGTVGTLRKSYLVDTYSDQTIAGNKSFESLINANDGITLGNDSRLTFNHDTMRTIIVPDTSYATEEYSQFIQTLPQQKGTFLLRPDDLPTETSLVTVSSTGTHAYKKVSELVDTTSEQTINSVKYFKRGVSADAGDGSFRVTGVQGLGDVTSICNYGRYLHFDNEDGMQFDYYMPVTPRWTTATFALTPYAAPTEPSVVVNAVDRTPTWKPVSELGGNALKVTVW